MVHTFLVVLNTELFHVTTSDNARIKETFANLKSESAEARRILGRISFDQCDYYKLKNPVHFPDDGTPADIIPECLNESNWQNVLPVQSLRTLAQSLLDSYVYIVIKPQEGELRATERAIAILNRDHPEIFSRLQIRVYRLKRWTMEDVAHNMAGGRLHLPNDERLVKLSEIEASLTRRRTYKVPSAPENRDYRNACQYTEHFHNIFESTLNQPGTVTDWEFVAFFNILRCFDEDSKRISADSSSALRTSNFIVYFMVPPFFSRRSKHFELKQKKRKIDTCTETVFRCRALPLCKSDCGKICGHPYYTDGRGRRGPRDVSCCFVVPFFCSWNDGAVTFLREMHNLVAMLEDLAKHLDKRKQDSLVKVDQDASKIFFFFGIQFLSIGVMYPTSDNTD
ncbi:hypothetical protein EV702DRAFT_1272237 [Suillus placidus]|uniref:Uncharacterized protein n=1 Tax=Suillus placidus TaxID=48579 RepID=A0A9P6ZH09_9AGAM|nr:hypothetical protein EV702DRAFT_1272237 [Suillus placidus]